MTMLERTRVCAAIVGEPGRERVGFAVVRGSAAWPGPTVDLADLLAASSGGSPAAHGLNEARQMLTSMKREAGTAAAFTLVVPTSWCSIRPMPLGVRSWSTAREELAATAEKLFPMSSDDALLGLLEAVPAEAAIDTEQPQPRGFVVAISRSRLKPVREALERLMGMPCAEVLALPMCVASMGMQGEAVASVIEDASSPMALRHTLEFGLVRALAEPAGFSGGEMPEKTITIEADAGYEARAARTRLGPVDVAIAAGLLPSVLAGRYVPLVGRAPRAANRWAMPAAAAVLAGLMVMGGFWARDARYRSAAADLEAQTAELSATAQTSSAMRVAAADTARMVEKGVSPTLKGWRSVLPVLREAQSAVPADGFAYRIEVTPTEIVLQGEAKRLNDVIEAVEAGREMTGARIVDPPVPIQERGLETFHVRAMRRDSAGGTR